MPLNLFETSVDRIPVELRSHYIQGADGKYRLNLSDLESYLRPLTSAVARFELAGALRDANVRPDHQSMLLRRLGDRVTVQLNNGGTITRISPSADGASTLEELVGAAAKEFPFLFSNESGQPSPALGASPAKTITRSELSALSAHERRRIVIDEKVEVVDDPERPARATRQGAKEMLRGDFEALSATERAEKMSDGWTLFD